MEGRKNVVFLGSRPVGYRCLSFLLFEQDKLGINLLGVLTDDDIRFNKDLSLISLCEDNDIPIIPSLEAMRKMEGIDILVSVQYHEILKQPDLAVAQDIAVNLHMAPLPEYRGCNQFSFAILNGDDTFGTTIHRMDTSIDGGDLLFESRFPIPHGCYVNELVELTTDKSVELFKDAFPKLVRGEYKPITQEELKKTRKSSFHLRKEISEIKQIDLSWDAEKIERHVRATLMPGFEPPYTLVDGKKIYFTKNYS